ncbi:YihY/virulence factor BrkB family protein [Egbenema bharatensis]|uniref:YihY/virulence factor BrkB family protein n=1 Tax=Egbenema bharatensis TaxID=3463334 RepID=UPI003A884971
MSGQPVVEFVKHRLVRVSRSRLGQLIIQASLKWQKDNCADMGAALAYYAIFSLPPTILVILSIFGFIVGPNTAVYNQILLFAQEGLPPIASQTVETVLFQLNQDRIGVGLIGFVLLLIAASGFFSALDRAFDVIWQVHHAQPGSPTMRHVAKNFIRRRIFSFALVFGAGLLLIVTLLANIIIRVILRLIREFSGLVEFVQLDTIVTVNSLQLISSFLILLLVLMVLFKTLPTVRIAWADVWLGAGITAILLLMLQNLVSRSVISIGSQFQSYGVVGGVMVLMLWIFLTSQIFFWGGEFTYVYTQMLGSRRQLRQPPR